jgi:hypothetical protein
MKLAQALGVTAKIVQPELVKKARIEGMNQEAKGEAAAAPGGTLDPNLMAKDAAYRLGATRASAIQSTLQAIGSIKQQLEDPNSPLSSAPAFDSAPGKGDGVLTLVDGLLRQQLGGLEKDPDAAKAITPLVTQFMNEVGGQRIQQQANNTRKAAVNNATQMASMDASMGMKTFDFSQQRDTLTKLFGGDSVTATAVLSQSLIDTAVAKHDPKILDMIPQSFVDAKGNTQAGPAAAPATAFKIAEARQKINVLQQDDNKIASNKSQLTIMSSVLRFQNPTAQLQQYAGMPGADPKFLPSAMAFFHTMNTNAAADVSDGSFGAALVGKIAKGDITNTSQLLTEIQGAGLSGKAASAVLSHGMAALKSVEGIDQDNTQYKAGTTYVDQMYAPSVNPLTHKFDNPAAVQQHAGAMLDFRTEAQNLIQQGKSPEEATNQALKQVQEKWGEPLGMATKSQAMPTTDADKVAAIMNAEKNPQTLLQAHITGAYLSHLRDTGAISSDAAAHAAKLILAARSSHH